MLADVASMWQLEKPQLHKGKLYEFEFMVLNRMSSQKCGRWYLPMLVFMDGPITVMYNDPLIILVSSWSSLLTS